MHRLLRTWFSGCLLLLFAGSTAPAALGEEPESAVDLSSHPWIGQEAPGFELETVTGATLSLKELRGKYVVIHFGASW